MNKILTATLIALSATSAMASDFVRPTEGYSVDQVVHQNNTNDWYYTDWFKGTYENAKRDLWLIDIGVKDHNGNHYLLDDWKLQHAAAYSIAWCTVVDREDYEDCFNAMELKLVHGREGLTARNGLKYYEADGNFDITTVEEVYSDMENPSTHRFTYYVISSLVVYQTIDYTAMDLARMGYSYDAGTWENKDGR